MSKSDRHLGPTSTRPLSPHSDSLNTQGNNNMEGTLTISKGMYCATTQCVICSADPYATAELAALIQEQAITLVEKLSKNIKKTRHCAVESDQEGDSKENEGEDDNTNKDNTDQDDTDQDDENDNSPYTWIGQWIQKPKGKCCRNSKAGHKGFTTKRLLKRARITKEQYSMYKVCL